MRLRVTGTFPPGGYAMRDTRLAFHVKSGSELALRGFSFVVGALQQACLNNPTSGCNPDYKACEQAVMLYNFERLPVEDRGRYFLVEGEVVESEPETLDASLPVKRKKSGCKTCGSRR
jgi:hypothetical protein